MDDVLIQLLADTPQLVTKVGEIRWQEWGHPPEPVDLDWWINVTQREAGQDVLPITWVAVTTYGEAVGAVGLAEYDIEERRDRTPWIVGMIVAPEWRGKGIGGMLLSALEGWARQQSIQRLWVATDGLAVKFYEKCDLVVFEQIHRANGEMATILSKYL